MSQAEFLQRIIESPEDDALRVAYADWLAERGDPRGEFIRAQCELAKRLQADVTQMAKDYEQRKALKRRAEELLKAHDAEWNRPMRESGCVRWEYRRGFVDTVVIPGDAFLKSAAVIFQAEPVQCLFLTESVPDMGALASLKVLNRLTELSLKGCMIGNTGAQVLASAPYLGNLTDLDLSYNDIGDAGAQALASSPFLSRLKTLGFYRPTLFGGKDPTEADLIHDAGAVALASSPYLSGLTRLYLGGNRVGARGREALRSRFGRVNESGDCGDLAIRPPYLPGATITIISGS